MITIKDVSKNGLSEALGRYDCNRCIKTYTGKDYMVNTIVHDGITIKVLDVYDGNKLRVRINDRRSIVTDLLTLVKRHVIIYNALLTEGTPRFKYDDALDNKKYIVFIPQDLVYIAEKLGLSREYFINDFMYLHISDVLYRYEKIDIIKMLSKLTRVVDYDNYIRLLTAKKIADLAYFDTVIMALMSDLVASAISNYSEVVDEKFIANHILNIIDQITYFKIRLHKALGSYYTSGNIELMELMYNELLQRRERFGLHTYLMMNDFENILKGDFKLNNFSLIADKDPLGYLLNDNAQYRLDKAKSFSEKVHMNLYGEEGLTPIEGLSSVNQLDLTHVPRVEKNAFEPLHDNIAEGVTGYINSFHEYSSNFEKTFKDFNNKSLYELKISRGEEVLPDNQKLLTSSIEMNAKATDMTIHRIYADKYVSELNLIKDIKYFKNEEEHTLVQKRLERLLKDIARTKMSYQRGLAFQYTPKVDLSIYDIIHKEVVDHYDYVNNIKYYGDDPVIGKLNEDLYNSAENFNLLTIPEYGFPSDSAAFSERWLWGSKEVQQEYEENDKKKRWFWQKDVYENGVKIRNYGDKVTFDNATTKEKEKAVRQLKRHILQPSYIGTYTSLSNKLTDLKKLASVHIDQFFYSIIIVVNDILYLLTFGLIGESNKVRKAEDFKGLIKIGHVDTEYVHVPKIKEERVITDLPLGEKKGPLNEVVEKLPEKPKEPKIAKYKIPKSNNIKKASAKIRKLLRFTIPVFKIWSKLFSSGNKLDKKKKLIMNNCKECIGLLDKILENKEALSENDVKGISKLKSEIQKVLAANSNTKHALSEKLNVRKVNQLNSNEISPLSSSTDFGNFYIKFKNTIKSHNDKLEIQSIDIGDYAGKDIAIFNTSDGKKIAFTLDTAYEPIPEEIKNKVILVNKIPINIYTKDTQAIQDIVNEKQMGVGSTSQIRQTLANTQDEDTKEDLVKELESKLLAKVKGDSNNGKGEDI